MIKVCDFCGKKFKTYDSKKHFCNYRCYWDSMKVVAKSTCEMCGREFTFRPSKRRKFCSKKCSAKGTTGGRNMGPRLTGWRQKLENDPDYRRTLSERMKKDNPMRKPEVVERLRIVLKKNADLLRSIRAGNGQRTKPQLLLHLKLGWPMEYPIPTGNPKWHAAVPDLANPELKIALECDGSSHNTPKQRNIDRKKDSMLAGLGWIVLRFKNKEILEQTESVLATIENVVKLRSFQ